jgi:hypothetical protein
VNHHSKLRVPIVLGGVAALTLGVVAVSSSVAFSQPAQAAPQSAVLTASCLNPTARLSVEENRLSFTLADNSDPSMLQSQSFATQMIDGAGFQDFGPSLVAKLCSTRSLTAAQSLVVARGKQLWRMAENRAQNKGTVAGTLPYSDDRPLYWTNLQGEAALQQWMPSFLITDQQRAALVTAFDKAARGMDSVSFPAGSNVRRLIMSGFDPYTLDGGQVGSAPGAVGNNIRHGNPSGATALAMDNTVYRPKGGTPVYIQAYLLPVDFPQFEQGYLEDTVGPWMEPGPEQVNASVTVSQAGPYQFNLEQWNARYHGVSLGNDNFAPCPENNGVPELAVNNPECNSQVVPQWGGPTNFNLRNPPQWTTTTLPIAQMIAANTGKDIPRPPGDGWPDPTVAFGVVWHTSYTEFPNCRSTVTISRNSPVPTTYPPPTAPIPPDPNSCSFSGGGGNYLSNESAYRNTLLRDRLGLDIPAGHIHTPDMQHFDQDDLYNPSDDTFNAWRLAIVEQARELLDVVATSAP